MPADYSRIHRLLKIITLIQGTHGWTPARLAEECDTTQRTIYRDLQILQDIGIPYFHDGENGYAIRRDFFLPPVQLTFDEALALIALAEQVGDREQIPFTRPASRAVAKIRGQLPPPLRHELEQVADHVRIDLGAAIGPEGITDVYETIRTSIRRKRMLRCTYEPAHVIGRTDLDKDHNLFLLEPYTLLFNQRAWYVLGHHRAHKEVRCLKLNRFTRIELTDQPYQIAKDFSLEQHLGNAWRMIRGKKAYDIELHFDSQFSETIADTHWHPTQEIDWNEDGSITFRCRVDGLDEIVWWILSMGPHCQVKKPAALIQRITRLAKEMVDRYEQKGKPKKARKSGS